MISREKVLMVLTHDRLDCMLLCLECLERSGAFPLFDHVVLLLNGVSKRHRRAAEDFMAARPSVPWDVVTGDGSRPCGICSVQNQCIQRHPGAVYVKTDDDIFVPTGWAERMLETYERFSGRKDLALITPFIPNNAFGLHRLLNVVYPEKLPEFERLFKAPPSPEAKGPTWQSPYIAEWAIRQFLNVDAANAALRARLAAAALPRWHEFCSYFSIGCICYDYDHVLRMGGALPPRDEPDWCAWFMENRQTCILDQSLLVQHYSFFVQQDWLDRTSLLEDLRRANLPGTLPFYAPLLPRLRFLSQLPRILRRRLGLARA